MNKFCAIALILAVIFTTGSLSAEVLQWEKRVIEVTASPRQERVKVAFIFKNSSNQQVTIQSVTSSCDCTTAELKKKAFAPGEAGQIDVVFEVGNRKGPQFKSITVSTEENPSEPIVLTLRVKIPELVEFTPHLLTWRVGEEPTEKSVEILVVPDPLITVIEAHSETPGIETRLEIIKPNRQYRLIVKPASTTDSLRSTLVIKTRIAGSPRLETFNVYAQVR